MLRPTEIEGRTLSIIDRAIQGQPIEDSRVELKAEWPADEKRAARRIAGHANAARGEPILWIVGVDEGGRRVTGAEISDFADWWVRVKACFDELAPEVSSVNVPSDGKTVVALCFETDRAPYVANN